MTYGVEVRDKVQWVVLHVLTDTWKILYNRNSEALESRSWTNTGDLEQLRRLDGTSRENDLLCSGKGKVETSDLSNDTGSCLVAIKDDLLNHGGWVNLETGSLQGQVQEGSLGRTSRLVVWVQNGSRNSPADQFTSVDTRKWLETDLLVSSWVVRAKWVRPVGVADLERTGTSDESTSVVGDRLVCRAKSSVRHGVVARLLVVLKDVVPLVRVVTDLVSPHLHGANSGSVVEHVVSGTRSSETFSANKVKDLVVQLRLWSSGESPIDHRVDSDQAGGVRTLGIKCWNLTDVGVANFVKATSLDDSNGDVRILRKSGGNGKTGSTTSYNHIVVRSVNGWGTEA